MSPLLFIFTQDRSLSSPHDDFQRTMVSKYFLESSKLAPRPRMYTLGLLQQISPGGLQLCITRSTNVFKNATDRLLDNSPRYAQDHLQLLFKIFQDQLQLLFKIFQGMLKDLLHKVSSTVLQNYDFIVLGSNFQLFIHMKSNKKKSFRYIPQLYSKDDLVTTLQGC